MLQETPWINCDFIEAYEFNYPPENSDASAECVRITKPAWIKKFSNGGRFIVTSDGTCYTVTPGWILGRAIPKDKEAASSPEWWDDEIVRNTFKEEGDETDGQSS